MIEWCLYQGPGLVIALDRRGVDIPSSIFVPPTEDDLMPVRCPIVKCFVLGPVGHDFFGALPDVVFHIYLLVS